MKSLLVIINFLFLLTLTSARESIIPNAAQKLQPSQKPEDVADKSTDTHSTYPPGFENTPPSHLPSAYSPPGSENKNTPPSHLPSAYSPPGSENTPPSHLPSAYSPLHSSTASAINSVVHSSEQTGSSSSDSGAAKPDGGAAKPEATAAKPEGGAAKPNPTTNIKTICDQTDYPDLCTATIAPFMKGNNNNVDPKQVLEVAMRASDQFAKLGFAMAKRASESPATPPNTKNMLKTCLDSWDTVLYNYQQAIEALRIHDSGRLSTMLSAAITDISDCEDAFQGVITPLIEYGEKMVKLTSICLALAQLI